MAAQTHTFYGDDDVELNELFSGWSKDHPYATVEGRRNWIDETGKHALTITYTDHPSGGVQGDGEAGPEI
jgi:hypothetical protein